MDNRRKIIALVLMLLWMAIIFSFSAQEATESSQQSMGIVKIIKAVAEKVTQSAKNLDFSFWDNVERSLRKLAHGFIYFVLGILVYNYLINCEAKKKRLISLAICLLYAISDEVHQLFVPGRSGQVSDVMVDFTGSVLGVILFSVLYWYFCSRRRA